jgi:glycosyltransferase involved in cell wall biosynthesis
MKVTIVVRTCNRPELLREALASIQIQSHKDWEVLIFDDAGSDINFNIFKTFKQYNPTHRIMYLTTQDSYYMFKNSWLIAPDLAMGDIMIRLDDDDILVEDSLEFICEVYTQNPELDFSYGSSVFFDDYKLTAFIETKNPFEHEKSRSAWAPYTIPNNKPWLDPWMFIPNYYQDPQPFTSIIHAAKANALCIYHTYVMRTDAVKKIKDKITMTSNFVDDLEFLGSLDYLGLGHTSLKKVLTYVRVHTEGRVSDYNKKVDGTDMWNENLRVRDKVDEIRPSGFISKIIDIKHTNNSNNGLDIKLVQSFDKTINKIKYITSGDTNYLKLAGLSIPIVT